MFYKSFTVKNFKWIDNVKLDIDNNRIITLVWLNESWKTTIMEAIQLFYKMIKWEKLAEQELNSYRPKWIAFTWDIEISWDILLEDTDIEKIRTWLKNNGVKKYDSISKKFDYNFKFPFNVNKYLWKPWNTVWFDVNIWKSTLYKKDPAKRNLLLKYIKETLVPEILYYDDFIFTIPDEISFKKDWTTVLNERHDVLNDIIKSVDGRLSFKESIVDIRDTDNDSAINRISHMEKKLNDKITNARKSLFSKWDKKINFKEISIKINPKTDSINFSFQIKTDSSQVFSINERSKWCKWFFSFLLFTEFRKNRTPNILFLLDEPASNLHSSAQAKILEAIENLSDKSIIIYSTHSHHLVNIKRLNWTYIVINEIMWTDSLEWDMTFMEWAKIEVVKYFHYVWSWKWSDKTSYFQPILDALDHKPSILEPIPNIVILEWKNDWYSYMYFENILKETHQYYPWGSATKLYTIIALYLARGKEFLVILDWDGAWQKAKEKYLEYFWDIVKNKIYTIFDILWKNFWTEKCIDEKDKEKILKLAFKEEWKNITKDNLNYAIMQNLCNKEYIKLEKWTTENFNKLFLFIKSKIWTK